MTEQTLLHLYNGILFLKKKEQIIDLCNNLEDIMFSDKRPPEKVTQVLFHLQLSSNDKTLAMQSRLVIAEGQGWVREV